MEQHDKDYNTRRPTMVIPEYGRNIQKMVDHAVKTESKDERNKIANAIISVMGQLNPQLRDVGDFKHKLWDHLFIISDFKLDVDSPYPIPDKEVIFEKPQKMDYPQKKIRYKHYGKSIEDLIAQAIKYEDGEEKKALVEMIANLMKKSYLTFNRESVDDELILADLEGLSDGQLKLEEPYTLCKTSDILALSQKKKSNGKNNKQNSKQKNFKKRRH